MSNRDLFQHFFNRFPPKCQVLNKMINAVKFEYNGSYVVCNNLTHYAMLKGLDVSVPTPVIDEVWGRIFETMVPRMVSDKYIKKYQNRQI